MDYNTSAQASQDFDPPYGAAQSSSSAFGLEHTLKQRDSTDIFIVGEIPEEGIEVAELEDKVGLTYSALSRRLFEMHEAGLVSRIRGADSLNPKSQPYVYFRAKGVTRDLVSEVAQEKRLDLGKIKEEFKRKSLRLREKKESLHRSSQDTGDAKDTEDVEDAATEYQKPQSDSERTNDALIQDPQALILGRLIQEIRTIKEENAFLKQEVAELKDRLIQIEKPSTRSSDIEAIMDMLNQLLSPNQIQNGKNAN